jgi:iron(III) transport system substrate-binding protein
MKAFGKFLTIILVISFLAACSTPAAPATENKPNNTAPEATTAPELTAAEQWAKANGVGPYQPETDDWAAIEEAAKKEGKVTVYANSSGVEDLQEAWTALYPDIVLDAADTDGIDTKMQAEQESGNVVGDVWFNSSGHILYGKFVPNQWMWSYVPSDMSIPELTADYPFAIARHSVDVIAYNNKFYPDGCPISNIWQLTEPEYKGRFFMEDPVADVSTMAKVATFIQMSDSMAQAYQDYYNKPWTEDSLVETDDSGMAVENAGYLFLKRLAYNQVVVLSDGDMVDAAFAGLDLPEGEEPGFGWTGYSSYKDTLKGELNMAPCFKLNPVTGFFKTSYLGIANKSSHPNASKLFIKFILSEAGYEPWNKIGTYPAVEGLPTHEDNMPLADILPQVWEMDPIFDWANVSTVRDFWAAEVLTAPK